MERTSATNILYKLKDTIVQNKFHIMLVLLTVTFITLFFYFNNNRDENNIFGKYQLYTNVIISSLIFLGIVSVVVSSFNSEQHGTKDGPERLKDFSSHALWIGIGLGMTALVAYALYYVFQNEDANYFVNFLYVLCGAIILFYGGYSLAKKYNLVPTTFVGKILTLLKSVLLFIPGVIMKGVNTVSKELRLAPKFVYPLLAIQFGIIFVFFILPLLFKYVIFKYNGVSLTKDETYYLDREYGLGNYETLEGNPEESDKKFNYNYAIHGWFFIHQKTTSHTSQSNVFNSIINYGNKPNIEFNADTNTLRVSALKGDKPIPKIIFETNNIKLQKWNNIVINYNGGSLDIFINGKLLHSEPGMVPYYTYDTITTGSENGIAGGITNVVYYRKPLSKLFIQTNYKLLKNKDKPHY